MAWRGCRAVGYWPPRAQCAYQMTWRLWVAQLGRDQRVCGQRHRGCWGSCGWVLGCPLRSRKNSSSQTKTATETSLRVDALHAHLGSRAGLALTAAIRAHSYWLSFFPDASLSGHCSPPALRFCPVRSGAGDKEERQLWGFGFLQTLQDYQDPSPTGNRLICTHWDPNIHTHMRVNARFVFLI